MTAAHADPPAAGGAERVAGDPGGDDREVGREARLEVVPEERDLPGERARGERAAVEHRHLARGREDGGDRHQEEDREEPVVADEGGDRRNLPVQA